MFLLPDDPLTTTWLTPEERLMADARVKRDTMGLAPNAGAFAGAKQAFTDPKLYLFAIMQNVHLASCGFVNFFPTVVKTMGFNTTMYV
jgi:hypothetical protein